MNIILPQKDVLIYISDILSSARSKTRESLDYKYHHNSSYRDGASICRYGILTLDDQNKMGIRNDSSTFLRVMRDIESHVNGSDSVSLAVSNLDDIYPNEEEYNPFSPKLIDFTISDNIKTYRTTIHYGNEFLCHHSISRDDIISIDIRLLKLISETRKNGRDMQIIPIISNYNYLRKMAIEMHVQKMNSPLREMSENDSYELDIDKLSIQPRLILK